MQAPFRGKVTAQLEHGRFRGIVRCTEEALLGISISWIEWAVENKTLMNYILMQRMMTYSIRDRAAHTRDHGNTTTFTKPNHLLSSRLRRHKSTCNVDLEHGIRVLSCIVKRRSLLLNTSSSDKPIETAMCGRDFLNYAVQMLDFTNVDMAIVQFCVVL